MLPKISETNSHNKLAQAFHLSNPSPRSLLDHWNIFREIANHPSLGDPWTAEILFFQKSG